MTISYFGYGSLVNVETLNRGASVRPGTLDGWVREWRIRGHSPQTGGVCSLTVAPEAGASIRGVAVVEPKEGLEALSRREWKYDRVQDIGRAFRCDASGKPGPEGMFLFRSKPEFTDWGDEDHPILQSYVDCVLAGFHAFWGEEGVANFIGTTRGWHVPILADRDCPRYPRAVKLRRDVRELIDTLLSEQGVIHLKPSA
ncbi:gamma-glutamylcyclotransferase family protein [Roseibium sp.]|uniref:gamma-glutamylcyclotransferase family protein n=1 Tax=Roseibium sp. TaxID=1936156 RepID=UPI003A9761E7